MPVYTFGERLTFKITSGRCVIDTTHCILINFWVAHSSQFSGEMVGGESWWYLG